MAELAIGGLMGSVFFLCNAASKWRSFFHRQKSHSVDSACTCYATTEVLLSRVLFLRDCLKNRKVLLKHVFMQACWIFPKRSTAIHYIRSDWRYIDRVLVIQLSLNLALSFLYAYRRSVYAPILIKAMYLLSVYLVCRLSFKIVKISSEPTRIVLMFASSTSGLKPGLDLISMDSQYIRPSFHLAHLEHERRIYRSFLPVQNHTCRVLKE